jgi:alanyl-tRNA synthetase
MKPEEVGAWLDENVVEIGNIVFMQYTGEKDKDKEPINLEEGSKNIDFGMGFERLLAIMQNQENVQDTDVLKPISDVVEKWKSKN